MANILTNIPEDCDSPGKRTEYLYIAQEQLRILHNLFGKWLKKGLTIKEYNSIPDNIKSQFKYVEKISQGVFDKFVNSEFTLRSFAITKQLGVEKELLKKSSSWTVDPGKITKLTTG